VLFILLIISFLIISCQPKEPKYELDIYEIPSATNILINQKLSESTLTGKFSGTGELHFVHPDQSFSYPGNYEVEWEFITNQEDTKNLHGLVTVSIYNYKITFEENGGDSVIFEKYKGYRRGYKELDDIYFNDIFTLEKDILAKRYGSNEMIARELGLLVVKNEYRFDGWTLENDGGNLLTYPMVFHNSVTLFAKFRYHTPEKVVYNNREVRAFYQEEDLKILRYPGYGPLPNSVEGEIVIADMIDNDFILFMGRFSHLKITSIILNNYITSIQELSDCTNLKEISFPPSLLSIYNMSFSGIEELFIPKTLTMIGTFSNCLSLVKVEYEEGINIPEELNPRIIGNFDDCINLKEVILQRVTYIAPWMFRNTGLEKIILPAQIYRIDEQAFKDCALLEEVIFQGINLRVIDSEAFRGCISLPSIEFNSNKLEGVGLFAFADCLSLKEISFPELTYLDPLAFYRTPLEKIEITNKQIQWIGNALHRMYIGSLKRFSEKIVVNSFRDPQYAGDKRKGFYQRGTNIIDLYFDDFSIFALDILVHEFYHYYEYILCYGIGDKNRDTVMQQAGYHEQNHFNDRDYPEYSLPDGFFRFKENPAIYFVLSWGKVPKFTISGVVGWDNFKDMESAFFTASLLIRDSVGRYSFISESTLEFWINSYIPLLEDQSNWDSYINQSYELRAKRFASYFSGLYFS
jgi:hypothetical protein